MIKIIKEKIAEYSHYFDKISETTNSYELESSLESVRHEVSLYGKLKASHLIRPNVPHAMLLPDLG